jgi:hypothetical protein
MKKINLLSTLFLLFAMPFIVYGQISLTTSSYTQNFNSFAGNSLSLPTGWTATGTFIERGAGTGTLNSGGMWAYGTGGDFSLGFLGASSNSITYTVSFTNNTGAAITNLEISYDFENWRNAGGNTIGFTAAGTGGLAGNASVASSLSQTSCSCGASGTPTVVAKTVTLSGLNIADGANFGISWSSSDGASTDNGKSIDNFVLNNTSAPLPVKLISFEAKRLQEKVQLNWSTASEVNNARFDIERSLDGKEFKTIQSVYGAGNSNSIKNYLVIDNQPAKAINYYRLKQIDFNGEYSYSGIVAIQMKGNNFEVSKLTATEQHVRFSVYSETDEQLIAEMYDLSGKQVIKETLSVEKGYSDHELENKNLSGIYIVRIYGSANDVNKVFKIKL